MKSAYVTTKLDINGIGVKDLQVITSISMFRSILLNLALPVSVGKTYR